MFSHGWVKCLSKILVSHSWNKSLSERWCLVSLSRSPFPQDSVSGERETIFPPGWIRCTRQVSVCQGLSQLLMWCGPSCGMWNDQDELCCEINKLFCFYLFCSIFLSFDFLWQKMVLPLREAGDNGFFFFYHRKEVQWSFLCECWKNSSRY